ncbi:MAG: LysR family transcriptional regulator [Shimia sp.]
MSLNLHHLRLFRAVAQEGALTEAARKLNISQSAVSAQVKALEASLGQQLFDRRSRALHLTEAGRIALAHADEIFRTAEDLTQTLRATGAPQATLRVGALATLSRNFQIGFIEPLVGRADVRVVVTSAPQEELLRGLTALALDVVLTNLAPARDAQSPYLVRLLAEQPVSLVGLPRAGDAPLEQLLTEAPLIVPTPEAALRGGFDTLTDRLGIVPTIAAEADDMAMLRLLARAGIGRAVIPPIVVRDELEAGTLVELSRLDGLAEQFYAVTTRRRFPNPLLAEVLGD